MNAIKIFIFILLVFFKFVVYSQQTFTINSNVGFTLSCANPSLVLLITSSYTNPAPTYTIFSPSNQTYTANTFTVITPGTWTITAVAGSLTVTQTLAIVINTADPSLTLTSSATSMTCRTPTILLSGLVSPLNLIFRWTEPGIGLGCVTNSCVAGSAGVYGLNVINPENGCSNSSTVNITDGRNFPILSSTTIFTIACPGGTVNLNITVLSPTTNLTYQWQSPSGAVPSAPNAPTLVTNTPGLYLLIVTDTLSGCNSNALISVYSCVGINANVFKSLKLFPNPIKNILHLEFEQSEIEITKVSITNSLGELVFLLSERLKKNEIDVSVLRSGIYHLHLQSIYGQRVVKVIKE